MVEVAESSGVVALSSLKGLQVDDSSFFYLKRFFHEYQHVCHVQRYLNFAQACHYGGALHQGQEQEELPPEPVHGEGGRVGPERPGQLLRRTPRHFHRCPS